MTLNSIYQKLPKAADKAKKTLDKAYQDCLRLRERAQTDQEREDMEKALMGANDRYARADKIVHNIRQQLRLLSHTLHDNSIKVDNDV